jgi:hypothetical protein
MLDGSHKTVELSCEATLNDSEGTWQEAQTTLYKQLGEQMRYVWPGNGNGKPAQEQPTPETPASKPDHYCQNHQKEFRRHEKEGNVWYSHRQGEGWHNE